MKLWILITGTFGLIWLGIFLLIGAFFTGVSGLDKVGSQSNIIHNTLTMVFIVSLPLSCLAAIVMLWIRYSQSNPVDAYWWFVLPLSFLLLFIIWSYFLKMF